MGHGENHIICRQKCYLKVPSQCSFVLLVEELLREGTTFEKKKKEWIKIRKFILLSADEDIEGLFCVQTGL
jgi:hypothetical protein